VYGDLQLDRAKAMENDTVLVTLNLANSGRSDGDEVVQLYVRDPELKEPQPVKSLKGFKRVFLRAGETKTVEIPLAVRDLGHWDVNRRGFVTKAGDYEIQAGASSADIRLKTRLVIQ
jgi:beta-glucosidase